jgi:hypothetical protein
VVPNLVKCDNIVVNQHTVEVARVEPVEVNLLGLVDFVRGGISACVHCAVFLHRDARV